MQPSTAAAPPPNFGNLRGRGAAITNNGKSSGAVSFMRLFDTVMDTVSQGATRRGSFAAYLDIDHPDIAEFLQIKNIGSPIQNLFYAVCVPDYWMQEMIDGDTEKRKIWARVLESDSRKACPTSSSPTMSTPTSRKSTSNSVWKSRIPIFATRFSSPIPRKRVSCAAFRR